MNKRNLKHLAWAFLLLPAALHNASAQTPTIGGGTCSSATLKGTYGLTFTGRQVTATGFGRVFQAVGSATFDGNGNVTFAYESNSNAGLATAFQSASGTYSLTTSCSGTLTAAINPATSVSYTLLSYNQGNAFLFTGTDPTFLLTGSGSVQPTTCSTATLSGTYVFDGTGYNVASGSVTSAVNAGGSFVFDGAGNVTATGTIYSGGQMLSVPLTGTYSLSSTSTCLVTATLKDPSGNTYPMVFSIVGANAATFNFIAADPFGIFSGSAHVTFVNPGTAVVNAASFRADATPSGSVLSIFGSNLSNGKGQATTVPLPSMLANTSVTINGKAAPLYYVDSGQINAQVPVEVGTGLATVVVKSGNTISNAVAVNIPAAAPGVITYGSNRAVVVNQDNSVNAAGAPAKPGDEVVAYLTGGGPVTPAGALLTGKPDDLGLAPVTDSNSVTVGGQTATVAYLGLTPGSIGLYQANFYVPSLAAGTYPVIVTVNGVASNAPVITIR